MGWAKRQNRWKAVILWTAAIGVLGLVVAGTELGWGTEEAEETRRMAEASLPTLSDCFWNERHVPRPHRLLARLEGMASESLVVYAAENSPGLAEDVFGSESECEHVRGRAALAILLGRCEDEECKDYWIDEWFDRRKWF